LVVGIREKEIFFFFFFLRGPDFHQVFLPVLATPTLVLHGDADGVNPIYSSEGKERWFTGPYQRKVMQGIGHFPQRESSHRVADEILKFCGVRS
jgi:pimeloyl-ACP methyl ester carboxylesterase